MRVKNPYGTGAPGIHNNWPKGTCTDDHSIRAADIGKSQWKRLDARSERRVGRVDLKRMEDAEDWPPLKVPKMSLRRPNRHVKRRS